MSPPISEHPPKSRQLSRILLVAVLVTIGGWLAYKWWWAQNHVTTDNAQIDASIVPIQPKVSGIVVNIPVKNNQVVQKGDLLVQLDERDYRARLAQTEADLALAIAAAGNASHGGQASAQVASARANAAAARSSIEQAQANADKAQKDLVRTRELVAKKMITPQALDTAEAAARGAAAQLAGVRQTAESAGEQVSASTAALTAAQAKVAASRAVRDMAANQLADTRLVAPVSGTIAGKNAEFGQLIAAGQLLLSVVPLGDIWITANLKETDLHGVKPGDAVAVEVDAYTGRVFPAEVESISPATGARFALLPPDNATGNFTKVVQRVPVRIRIKQSDDPEHMLRAGMSVVVTITTK
jgi:membrane fusion protein (multidrug efflux system)